MIRGGLPGGGVWRSVAEEREGGGGKGGLLRILGRRSLLWCVMARVIGDCDDDNDGR